MPYLLASLLSVVCIELLEVLQIGRHVILAAPVVVNIFKRLDSNTLKKSKMVKRLKTRSFTECYRNKRGRKRWDTRSILKPCKIWTNTTKVQKRFEVSLKKPYPRRSMSSSSFSMHSFCFSKPCLEAIQKFEARFKGFRIKSFKSLKHDSKVLDKKLQRFKRQRGFTTLFKSSIRATSCFDIARLCVLW